MAGKKKAVSNDAEAKRIAEDKARKHRELLVKIANGRMPKLLSQLRSLKQLALHGISKEESTKVVSALRAEVDKLEKIFAAPKEAAKKEVTFSLSD
jgi:hypothetical protein